MSTQFYYFICHSTNLWIDQEPLVLFLSKRKKIRIVPSAGQIYGNESTYEYSQIINFLINRGWGDQIISKEKLNNIIVKPNDILIPLTFYKGSLDPETLEFAKKFSKIEYLHYGYPRGEIQNNVKMSSDYTFTKVYVHDLKEYQLWENGKTKIKLLKKPFQLSKFRQTLNLNSNRQVVIELHHPKIPETSHTESGYIAWNLIKLLNVLSMFPEMEFKIRLHPVLMPKIQVHKLTYPKLSSFLNLSDNLPKNVLISNSTDWRVDFFQSDLIFCESPSLTFKCSKYYRKNVHDLYQQNGNLNLNQIESKSMEYVKIILEELQNFQK